jgi:hypothetical protein
VFSAGIAGEGREMFCSDDRASSNSSIEGRRDSGDGEGISVCAVEGVSVKGWNEEGGGCQENIYCMN